MQKILESYLRRLTNLTGSNRSLLIYRLLSDQTIDLHDFNRLMGDTSFSIIEGLIAGKKMPLCPIADARDQHVNKLSLRLKKLNRIDEFIHEERGMKDLYVGWPFVRGKFNDGTAVRCPLIFFPVRITQTADQWILEPRKGVNITLNKPFLLAYSYYNKIRLTDELTERVFEVFDKDSRVFRTELYQLFKQSPIEINFNQENFIDQLHPFASFRKEEFVKNEKEGELKLYPEAVLGIFPQAGSHLVPDYLQLLEQTDFKDIESFFASRIIDEQNESEKPADPRELFRFLKQVKEEETYACFKLDAWQENALNAIKRGNSMVVQGPPGTGKSQLICNLITDYVARGKKVLVVCQKRAALDVIYQRLHEVELQEFAVLMHDFKNDRKDIYNQIKAQIDRLYEYELKNKGLDTIFLEREFLQSCRRIDQVCESLEEFKAALFDEKEFGLSIKELYLNSDPNKPNITLKQEYKFFTASKVPEMVRKIREYVSYESLLNSEYHPWRDRKTFAQAQPADLHNIKMTIKDVLAVNKDIKAKTLETIGHEIDFSEGEVIHERDGDLRAMLSFLSNVEIYKYFKHIIRFPIKETNDLWLGNIERMIRECFGGLGPELSVDVEDLGTFQQIVHKRMEAGTRPLKMLKWLMFSKDKGNLKRVMLLNGLKINRKGLKKMSQMIDNRLNLEHNITKLYTAEWITAIPKKRNLDDFKRYFNDYKLAVQAKRIFLSFTNFNEYFAVNYLTLIDFKKQIGQLLQHVEQLSYKKLEWEIFLNARQINEVCDEQQAQVMIEVLERDFDLLCAFDNMRGSLEHYELNVLNALARHEGSTDIDYLIELFKNSLYLEWINHIETKFPKLRQISTPKMELEVRELQEMISTKTKLCKEIMLIKARENTYKTVEYNRLNNRTTYRELEHQTTKKSRVWPIRKLIKEYKDELLQLTPCWLASPESVSTIFPMEEIFDLVIFDEASQCFVEKGIPAMYRGKQVVVVGDHQQLSPNDLYKVRWEDEEQEGPALEIDSLLDLANHYLPDVQLRGHYRSKSLDLIDFSNTHFYQGKLRLLPDFTVVNRAEPGIQFIKVDGIWEKNCNLIEAQKTIALLKEIWTADPHKEVGIVTFNAMQQSLIRDLIDDEVAAGKLSLAKGFILKNIENVQGDEKDIIIFSIGYAPDAKGKMQMQFGNLNAVKGENRLNVAVTRAKEKVLVVSSIFPDQLKVEDTKNEGPKMLKSYLQYAKMVSEGHYKYQQQELTSFGAQWFLKKKIADSLHSEEFTTAQELPFADLTLKENQSYLGLVLTDDDLYYNSASVKEAHAYTPFLLNSKNWKFTVCYSRAYWRNQQEVHDQVKNFGLRMQQNAKE